MSAGRLGELDLAEYVVVFFDPKRDRWRVYSRDATRTEAEARLPEARRWQPGFTYRVATCRTEWAWVD